LTAAIQDIERREEVEEAEYEAQLMVLTPEEANLKVTAFVLSLPTFVWSMLYQSNGKNSEIK